ncbi:MFS transporter [Rhodococcus triatomae]|uniref:MFS transporter, NNP family, nitrate/nitrite transporter n=1 Tax=Rhodococcus triatomae TaxID=300028 RepID=A0A1G8FH79_9NOCA|nr:MFS transporter [Rhodococcus triatomae]QNG19484.1 MFS transporter [Rhodococcus triatomae]QNG24601.1 MFS transporter [Rhodococcus triatomae]SDH81503.1 MFS transporter, NNP family, nitrate/nitrite transporter [Rhodococcus triatomae]
MAIDFAARKALADGTPTFRPGRWIDHWDPENDKQWHTVGKFIARRNLILSMVTEFLGFAMLALWGIVVPQLNSAGFDFTSDQLFWLIALPGLTGAVMRFAYTFTVPIFGGRNWTVISALLLLLPSVGLVFAVNNPDTSFPVMLAVASLAGLGGGNFTSSMVNISFFYPQREKGKALGINAAGGNLGTAWVQFTVPLVIVGGAGLALDRAGLIFVPLCVLAAILAWRYMDNLSCATSDGKSLMMAVRNPHTWIISVLYIGTFGSFIGYANTFPTLLKSEFPEITANIVFLGALTGALLRPLGGIAADRFGGARVTVFAFAVMALGVVGLLRTLESGSFALFLATFLVLFGAAGVGNGSTYRMIPAVFQMGRDTPEGAAVGRRLASGCIGIAGAIGALGGFFIPRVFAGLGIEGGFQAFLVTYLVMMVAVWAIYQRRNSALATVRI